MLLGARRVARRVARKLGKHHADRATVGNAVAHQCRAEQGRRALRAYLEPEGAGDVGRHGRVAIDGHQHLVGHEGSRNRDRGCGRRNGCLRSGNHRRRRRCGIGGSGGLAGVASAEVAGSAGVGGTGGTGGGFGKRSTMSSGSSTAFELAAAVTGRLLSGHAIPAAGRLPRQAIQIFLRQVGIVGLRRRGKGGDKNRRREKRRGNSWSRANRHSPVSCLW